MMLSIPSLKYLLALLVLCGSVPGLTLAGNTPSVAAQQEIQITLLGTHPLPGLPRDIVIADNRAYVAYDLLNNRETPNGIQILDISDSRTPVVIGEYITGNRVPFTLVTNESYIFVYFTIRPSDTQDGQRRTGFMILDVQDATNPQLMGTYEVASSGGDLAVVGNQVYLGLNVSRPNQPRRGQLQIFDVRNPAAPVFLGRYDVPDDVIEGMAAQGNLVYLGGFDTGFTVLDASDPANPTLIGRWTTPGTPPVRPVVEGDVLYFADRNLFTIDISDPTNPQTLAVGGAAGTRIRVQDGIVYLVGNTTSSLNIVDARNPRNLVRLAQYGEDIDLAIPAGDLVYLVADDQLQIVRVTGIPADPPADPPSPTARCFDETGFCIDGRIRDYWEQNGGLPVFGFPISPQRTFTIEGQSIEAQWFERNRLELHPENEPPYDVLLGRLGVDVLAQQGRDWQAFPRDEAAQSGCRYFAETQQNVCGDILTAWRANGLELGDLGISERESLALFGLPISPLQEEEIEGETYQVQWFERARFELHPENAPPFDVLLGLLGREAHTSSPAPQPTAAPVANPTATPSGLPAPGSLGGWIAFTSEGNIFTINADGSNREQLTTDGGSSFGAWSPDARRILFTSGRDGNAEVYVMDADGSNQTRLTEHPRDDGGSDWSLNGNRILFRSERDGFVDIYVMNSDGSNITRLTSSMLTEIGPKWSPDGTRIAFSARPAGEFAIYVMNADGSNLQRIAEGNFPRWSPDGTQLVFTTFVAGGGDEVLVINADGTGLTNLSNHPANDFDPRWSPDGMRIAFVSDRDPDIIINNQPPMAPQSEIYVMRADGSGQTRLTAAPTQKVNPTWSPDGTRLLYRVLTVVLEQPGTLFLMNADGSGQTELVEGGLGGWQPAP